MTTNTQKAGTLAAATLASLLGAQALQAQTTPTPKNDKVITFKPGDDRVADMPAYANLGGFYDTRKGGEVTFDGAFSRRNLLGPVGLSADAKADLHEQFDIKARGYVEFNLFEKVDLGVGIGAQHISPEGNFSGDGNIDALLATLMAREAYSGQYFLKADADILNFRKLSAETGALFPIAKNFDLSLSGILDLTRNNHRTFMDGTTNADKTYLNIAGRAGMRWSALNFDNGTNMLNVNPYVGLGTFQNFEKNKFYLEPGVYVEMRPIKNFPLNFGIGGSYNTADGSFTFGFRIGTGTSGYYDAESYAPRARDLPKYERKLTKTPTTPRTPPVGGGEGGGPGTEN